MLDNLINFLSKLEQNNSKTWLDKNRDEYNKLRDWFKFFVEKLINEIARFDNDIGFLEPKNCIYRLNRDVRFSHNKLPYKTYFSASFHHGGKCQKDDVPGYYFQIDSDGILFIAGGSYMIESKKLLRIRKQIVKDPQELKKVLADKKFVRTFYGLSGNQLKTHPRGFDKDHKDIDLLRYKNFTAGYQKLITNFDEDKLQKNILKDFNTLLPFVQWLRGF